MGWRLYPASRTSKAARFPGATAAATSDLNTISKWCREYGQSNWRVVMAGSGIWGMDIDAPGETHAADGIQAFKDLVAANGPLPAKPMTRSGGGGYAIFFAHTDEKITGRTGVPAPGLDPRRGNLSVTIPPSIHVVTRQPYRWLARPWEVAPPEAPEWLLKLVAPPPEPTFRPTYIDTSDAARMRLSKAVGKVLNSFPGERNAELNRQAYVAGRLIGAGLVSEQEVADALYGAGRAIRLEHHEIKATIMSGVQAGRLKPWENRL